MENKNYNFTALSKTEKKASPKVSITTMDTTSHNFTWQSYSFGGGGSSYFSDVAIIDENNIWAVGAIYTEDTYTYDSNGVWIEPYNAAHWNGEKWKLERILYYGNCSAVKYPPITSIWVIDDNNILLTNGGSVGYFNGTDKVNLDCRINTILTGAITKIWGSSRENIYAVGYNGNIAHYNGNTWKKLITSTETEELDIYDIKGFTKNNKTILYAVAAKRKTNSKKQILKIDGNNIEEVVTDGLQFSISGIWGIVDEIYYIVGAGVLVQREMDI